MVASEGVVVVIAPCRSHDHDLPINTSIKQTDFICVMLI